MRLNNIKLHNIRSYLDVELNFPKQGSLLLSGDIGTGKSTILLAIDFALFGIRRGDLSGSALLRNGADDGYVELNFEIDDKEIIIRRNLKREDSSVTQDKGFISINNEEKELTAVELKQEIINLLNYPQESLTKSKSLIYHYTVYTPQEEMKHILLSENETRLGTLRKVFEIDKYKRIEENSKIFVAALKEKKKELTGMIVDLDSKKQERIDKEKEAKQVQEKIKLILPKITVADEAIKKNKSELKNFEEKIKQLNERKKELELTNLKLTHTKEQASKNNRELTTLNFQIESLKKEVQDHKEVGIKPLISEKRKLIVTVEEKIHAITLKINEFSIKKQNSEDIKKSIVKLDVCPTCKQNVNEDYKKQIVKKEEIDINKAEENIQLSKKKEIELNNYLKSLKEELEELQREDQNYELIKLKKQNLTEKTRLKQDIEKQNETLDKESEKLNLKIKDLNESIKVNSGIESDYNSLKEKYENLFEEKQNLEIGKARLERNREDIMTNIDSLNDEIKKKELAKFNLEYFSELQFWLEEHFVNLMVEMERQVMLNVHSDFNDLFQKWFNILMDNEVLNVRLDEEFTPVIEQNGYETDYLNLSGGEKTAVALAYRLALNQVINNLMSNIKTRDIIILDEPTDGFSNEQLDKVKLVLNELKINQIIIVSHESKIETFVDHIVKLNKKEHVTFIEE